jgi:hypothetical protein
MFIKTGSLAFTGTLAGCGGGNDEVEPQAVAQVLRAKAPKTDPAATPAPTPAPAPAPTNPVAQTRPFRSDSIWNIPIPDTASRAGWIDPWSSATSYSVGDCVRVASGLETWIYVCLTSGAGRALPSGQNSNADWRYCGVSLSQWYDSGAGTPVFQAASTDPVWTLQFNSNCYWKLASGAWSRQITDAAASDGIWNDAATLDIYPTDYNGYVTVSSSGLQAPGRGTYDPKGSSQTDLQLLPSKELRAPVNIMPSFGGTDWTMIVQLPDGTVLETFATVLLTGNRIVCGSYKITRPELSGDGWQNGFRASMIPGYAGLITQAEWAAAWQADIDSGGTAGVIPHVLALLAPARILKQSMVYPAYSWDSQSNNPYTGTKFRMGERIALPPAFSLTSSDFTSTDGRFARIIGRTMKTYGGIVVDRGGDGFTFLHEASNSTSSVVGPGGGALPNGSWKNDQMLRKVFANTEAVSIPAGSYTASA